MNTKKIFSRFLVASFILQLFPVQIAFGQVYEFNGPVDEVKEYEQVNPEIQASLADRIVKKSSTRVKSNVESMLGDFKEGVKKAVELSVNGTRNGQDVVIVMGVKDGWKVLKEHGKRAGIHYLDSIRLLPQNLKSVGYDFEDAGMDISELATKNAKHTADVWKVKTEGIKSDVKEAVEAYKDLSLWASDNYVEQSKALVIDIKRGSEHSIKWSKRVLDWTVKNEKIALNDLKTKPIEQARLGIDRTKNTAIFFKDATLNTLKMSGAATVGVMDWTKRSTVGTYNWTVDSGKDVFTKSMQLSNDFGNWVKQNSFKPLTDHTVNGIKKFSKFNWRKGYTEGVKEGFKTAANAFSNRDYLMGTIWSVAGIGKGLLHVVVLEPTVVPLIATYGVAGTTALTTLGYPSVGLSYGLGTTASGITFAGGGLATGSVALGGTIATLGTGVGTLTGTVGVGSAGIVSTAAVGSYGLAATTTSLGYNSARVIGTPVVGGIGMGATFTAGAAEVLGATVWRSGIMAGVTGLTAGGYALIPTHEMSKIAVRATLGAGVTVFDNAIATPFGVVTNLGQALATGSVTMARDPVKGTIRLVSAAGVGLGTLVTSTGAFAGETLLGTLKAMRGGIGTVVNSGAWLAGATLKVGEVAVQSFNLPKYNRWAEFRKDEVEKIFARAKKAESRDIAERFGEVILTRVFWYGKDKKGRVRAFISKDPNTKERWFFKRHVDENSCKILYSATNKAPIVRSFGKKKYEAIYDSGLHYKPCEQAK